MPVGTFVYNIELKPGAGGVLHVLRKLLRGCCARCRLHAHQDAVYRSATRYSDRMGNGVRYRMKSIVCVNSEGRKKPLDGSAASVRGAAMNPVDHPHGGGEGKQGRGHRIQKTLWGKPAGKGQKTRRPKKYSNVFIVSRRRVGKRK